jgi:hypothetical protein
MTLKHMIISAVSIAAVAALVPSASSAHCLPGNIHMHGYEWWDCNTSSWHDSGCIYIGTVSRYYTESCGVSDPQTGFCECWNEYYWYNCDGC